VKRNLWQLQLTASSLMTMVYNIYQEEGL
jgi:hypothetical protein